MFFFMVMMIGVVFGGLVVVFDLEVKGVIMLFGYLLGDLSECVVKEEVVDCD